ncbi:MAG: glycine--tRNA ligase subunit beta [Trueperaceae bacterium]
MNLLFEIGTEELPSWYVLSSWRDSAELMNTLLAEAKIEHGKVTSYATPRRIAVFVENIAATNTKRTELRRGPAVSAAYDAEGNLTKAALGFAKANNTQPEQLVKQDTDKGSYIYAEISLGGQDVRESLPSILKEIVEKLPAKRKMRWADVPMPFVRPINWLVALLDKEVISFEAAGVTSSNTTYGHRFLSPEPKDIKEAKDYVKTLEKMFVIPDPKAREEKTLEAAQTAAERAGLSIEWSDALLRDISHIVEYPIGILGNFDESYLELPAEVLATTMIHHQRFFPTKDKNGKFAAHFVGISNNKVPDESVVRQGYEQVLGGRLYDAKFFWDADRKKSLSQHAWGLGGIAFQKELGSMGDKISRVAVTAKALAETLGATPEEKETLEHALPIFRADRATQMVGELPELEGVMSRTYALAEGHSPEVANALEDGMLPKGPSDPLPRSNIGAVLATADKLDMLVGFFAINKRPSGSADPFGLRREANGLARILNAKGWTTPLSEFVTTASQSYTGNVKSGDEIIQGVINFLWDRVQNLLLEESIRVELVRAATSDNPAIIAATRRCHLLQTLSEHQDFPALMTLYRRATTLANQAPEKVTLDPKLFNEYETALAEALPKTNIAIERLLSKTQEQLQSWDLGKGPKQKLSGLEKDISEALAVKAPLDAFLDNVMVMVDDTKLKNNRLVLLKEVRDVLRTLGNLEELEGL